MNKTVIDQNALGRETGLIYRWCFINDTCSMKRQDTGKNKLQPDRRQVVRRGDYFWKLLMCHSEQQVFSSDWKGEDDPQQQRNERSKGNWQKQVGGSKHQHLGGVRGWNCIYSPRGTEEAVRCGQLGFPRWRNSSHPTSSPARWPHLFPIRRWNLFLTPVKVGGPRGCFDQ